MNVTFTEGWYEANVKGPVLWAGGLRDVKRPDLFIELARRFPQREFVIVGGPTTTSGAYAAEVEEEHPGITGAELDDLEMTFAAWVAIWRA